MQEGIRLSLSDRPASNDRLEQAREAFESLTSGGAPAPVREQALLGLSVTLESLSDGDTEPAVSAYQKLLAEFPQSRFKDWAAERIDALKTGSAQEFYAWFRQQNPKPADMPLPKDRAGTSNSSLDSLLDDIGGAALPGADRTNPFDSTPLNIPLSGSGGGSKASGDGAGPDDSKTDSAVGESEQEESPSAVETETPPADGSPSTPAGDQPVPDGEPASQEANE